MGEEPFRGNDIPPRGQAVFSSSRPHPSESAAFFDNQVGELAEALHDTISCPELFDAFASGVADALCADLVQLLEYVPGEGGFVLRSGRGFADVLYDRARVPAGLLSQAGRALLDPMGSPVALGDFSAPHEWADDHLLREYGARSGVVVKISTGARDFGTLGVFYRSLRQFPPEEEGFLLLAASLLGSGIERLECGEAAVAWRSRAEILRAGTALLRVPARPDEVLYAAVLAAVSGGDGSRPLADWCFADALEADGTFPKLRRVAADHAEGADEKLEEAFSSPLEPSAPHGAPRAYATRQGELVERIGPDFISAVARNREHRQALEEARPYSYMCVPVTGRDRFHGTIGCLRVETGTATPYKTEDLATCADFAALVGEAIDRGSPRQDVAESREHAAPLERVPTCLTGREREVLELIADGSRLTDIGARLHIDYQTVRTHKRHLCQKLGLDTRSPHIRIVAEAKRSGYLAA